MTVSGSNTRPRRLGRGPLARLPATLLLSAALLAGGTAVAGGESFADTPATDTTADPTTSCPSVTGTQSATPTAGWTSQQAAQAFATEKLAASPRTSRWVSLPFHGQTMRAWADYPIGKRNAPVVLVLHEVFGLTDSTRNTADKIAAMGYIAITPDMISGLGPDGGGDARTLTGTGGGTSDLVTAVPDEEVSARIGAWVNYAEHLPRSTGQTDIVGLSWGGGAAFRYAATGTRSVDSVFVFYDVGPPAVTQGCHRTEGLTDYPVDKIAVPVHGFYGETDTRVMTSLPATTEAMSAAGKYYDPVVYAGADHAFMRLGEDPSDTNAANSAAERASLKRLKKEIRQSFAR
ncbi:dienelactone hydrolase family protein [Streptomyces sp. CA-249302]|uniref:dienelactone hydrolase family protein n=1 Tax=Streptomyces sp. CA-249302 TaxID=3240058 RepID=UPI003D90DEBF